MTTDLLRVLLIDDSEDDRMLYRRALSQSASERFAIAEAADGEEGIERIEALRPDCVLLDYSLPGRDGVEVLKRLRARWSFLPVLMLTGQGNEEIAVTAIRAGAHNYMTKGDIVPERLALEVRLAVEQGRLQRRFAEQRESLEVFTRALAHDLKEPLRTLQSFSQIIGQRERLSAAGREQLEFIQSAAVGMLGLVETVFLYTRLDDPREMPREDVDASEVLADVVQGLERLIVERRARIESEALPRVLANRQQLMQVLGNLITNAIQHSDPPVLVRVAAEPHPDGFVFEVRDDGAGIDPEHRDAIFAPFKRLDRESAGTGLGLSISRKILESHGGRIWCESRRGSGASFFFTLPSSAPGVESEERGLRGAPRESHQGGERLANVLIVDDKRADIELTRFFLVKRAGLRCNLLFVQSGKDALDMLRDPRSAIDLVLLDINMPGMDGFQVLEAIRAEGRLRDVGVVMCTGSTYDRDMVRAAELGAAGYLSKPVELDALVSTLDRTPTVRLARNGEAQALVAHC